MNLTNGLRSRVLQDEVASSVEGAAFGIDVDVSVDSDDLGLRKVFVLLPVTLVPGLYVASVLGSKVFVEDMSVVEIPYSAAGGDEE